MEKRKDTSTSSTKNSELHRLCRFFFGPFQNCSPACFLTASKSKRCCACTLRFEPVHGTKNCQVGTELSFCSVTYKPNGWYRNFHECMMPQIWPLRLTPFWFIYPTCSHHSCGIRPLLFKSIFSWLRWIFIPQKMIGVWHPSKNCFLSPFT